MLLHFYKNIYKIQEEIYMRLDNFIDYSIELLV